MKKDIKWAKEELKEALDIKIPENQVFDRGYQNGVSNSLDILNQLDEAEVLSQPLGNTETFSNAAEQLADELNRLGGLERDIENLTGMTLEEIKEEARSGEIVPKQEEADQAYKDGYEKGKEHATEKQSEKTETVAGVLVDYLIASAKLKLALNMEVEELEE